MSGKLIYDPIIYNSIKWAYLMKDIRKSESEIINQQSEIINLILFINISPMLNKTIFFIV